MKLCPRRSSWAMNWHSVLTSQAAPQRPAPFSISSMRKPRLKGKEICQRTRLGAASKGQIWPVHTKPPQPQGLRSASPQVTSPLLPRPLPGKYLSQPVGASMSFESEEGAGTVEWRFESHLDAKCPGKALDKGPSAGPAPACETWGKLLAQAWPLQPSGE